MAMSSSRTYSNTLSPPAGPGPARRYGPGPSRRRGREWAPLRYPRAARPASAGPAASTAPSRTAVAAPASVRAGGGARWSHALALADILCWVGGSRAACEGGEHAVGAEGGPR
jgi:hypothetical protein